jgi:hypothetical protein
MLVCDDEKNVGLLGSLRRASQQDTKGDYEFFHFVFSF